MSTIPLVRSLGDASPPGTTPRGPRRPHARQDRPDADRPGADRPGGTRGRRGARRVRNPRGTGEPA